MSVPPTGSTLRDASWTVYEMAGLVLPDVFIFLCAVVVVVVEVST